MSKVCPDFSYFIKKDTPHDIIKVGGVLQTTNAVTDLNRTIKIKKIYAVNVLTHGNIVIDFDGVEVNP
ncbi:hypothetical protein [Pelosinus fermentans]|uniref:Uncharacterized protein n=1 Tax=Pelosinus fermentans JBW45 TaxID=1192197 RepID=I9DCE8_9FIRM|nr:hypothetical protein [Pelosinus fermentans]AJQ26896.1 hypothetical protein JBW_01546 [Pelosinus fermentans JBW45]